ncbi:hypothetical protein HYC85_025251 [Camellia sinensis]|uniref:CRIB domain-containing protein n=1 Tax=Camellia sinensis TaxID=4442 RepID=A0A7J7GBS9_CAMSI|nr:hypothetical protein HYC85_025251 [Camellia sinensis]
MPLSIVAKEPTKPTVHKSVNRASSWIGIVVFTMATKIKGLYKGFKYISQIFVVKEREMEIGYPTDVKHVAHIGWDGPSGSAPSWMNEFRTASDFAVTSIGNLNETRGSSSAMSTWSSQDFESMYRQPAADMFKDVPVPPTDLPNIPKKSKRKKIKSTSSPKSSSSRSSRAAKSKAKIVEDNARTTEVM